ncbi:MAG: GWxTD domain-containing protein [candidate division KSB1 bacterium]|nr:GWxTD domain-containing protein [candidate division KSB1 bacterium]MDZ7275228.1 GWxTD domain-containing protein [candidate division KSB1 bacterium]MDZ7287396.1 GWxTD domain-containing protein [candidate division KSB1 bacterium]MDZ7299510.1 GWxTD domain-containing protein [candidate division KSB1 bacterium]MDZ7305445.1 GWxTD domain-containing protein [candidate division KSB1 bacterium]
MWNVKHASAAKRRPLLRCHLGAGLAACAILVAGLRAQPGQRPDFADDSLRAEQQYLTALQQADSLTFVREFEAEWRLLLADSEQRDYDSLPTLPARKACIISYWKANNPNPFRPHNERLLEHLRRREYVRQYFPAAGPPYCDDRGRYYLKYGKPHRRFQDPGGYRRIAFFNLITHAQVRRLYPFKQVPDEHYLVVANETWSYENVTHDFVVHFKREGAGFREVRSLTELVATRLRRNLAWQWGDLIKQRAGVAPVMVRTAEEVGRLEMELLQAAMFSRRGELSPGAPASPNERLLEIAWQHEAECAAARRVAPTSAHEPAPGKRLQFSHSIVQFRAPDGQTRVEITLLAPFAKQFVDHQQDRAGDSVAVDFACLLRDPNRETLATQQQRVCFPLSWLPQENLSNAAGLLAIISPPQHVTLLLQVQNPATAAFGIATRPLQVRAFTTDSLQLSEIQFYWKIDNDRQARMLPRVVRQELVLAPYPWPVLRRRHPVFCYFEIYNLQAAGLAGSYELSYEITAGRSRTATRAPALRVSHERPLTGDTAAELIALALQDLDKGPHRIEIAVRETGTHRILASMQREIVIEE